MNTTIVDGVEIKQGDEVTVKLESFTNIIRIFLADLGEKIYANRYVCTALGSDEPEFHSEILPIPKKQRVPLTQEDIVKKYWNGAVRIKGKHEIYKILGVSSTVVWVRDNEGYTLDYLKDGAEITSGPDSNGVIVWDECSKEV